MRAISLMYHDIVADNAFDSSGFGGPDAARYKLDASEFNAHITAIKNVRNTVYSISDFPKTSHTIVPLFLTFDDGGSSATLVADCLENVGFHGHFFITTDRIGTPGFVNELHIQELRERGHMIGSHSCSHPDQMARCTYEELLEEWRRSVGVLSNIIQERVCVASVPGGYYSRRVAKAASKAGIRALFTSEPQTSCVYIDSCLVLGRYTLRRGMGADVAAALASGQMFARLRQTLSWNSRKIAKAVAGRHLHRLLR